MASYTEVNKALDLIAVDIAAVKQSKEVAKTELQAMSTKLGALATVHADMIATVDAYTPTGAFESLAKDKRAKYTTEFVALKNAIDAAITALG